MKNKTSETHHLDEMIDVVMKVARGNYSTQVKLSGKNDEIDSLAMGLNMMIDDIKKREKELRIKDSVIASSINAMAIVDTEGYLTFVNPSFIKLWGYDKEDEVVKRHLQEFWHAKEKYAEVIETLRNCGSWTGELIAKRKDGSTFYVQLSANTISDETDKATCMLASFIDITERKMMEDRLRKQAYDLGERVKELNCLYGIASIIQKPNISLEKILQETVKLISWSWQYPDIACARIILDGKEYKTDNFMKKSKMHSREIIVNGKCSGSVEVCYTEETPDGAEEPFLKEEENLINAVAERLGRIVERKQTEEKLQHYTTELEQSNKEIKQFAYIVSHDLRAPLVNLKGFSGELHSSLEEIGSAIKEALPHLDEKQRHAVTIALDKDVPEALEFIDSSVTRMDNFINAVLRLSRLGRRNLTFELIDMNTLVQASLKTFAHQIEKEQIKVAVKSLPEVSADRTSMEQIMGNLLTNAILYLDPCRPGKIEVSAEQCGNSTIFKISDNGRGIAGQDMEKVFAPFRRAGKEDVIGEGMGLAYVKTLVHRHEGRIWCESEYGVGTTFTFTISNLLKKGGSYVQGI